MEVLSPVGDIDDLTRSSLLTYNLPTRFLFSLPLKYFFMMPTFHDDVMAKQKRKKDAFARCRSRHDTHSVPHLSILLHFYRKNDKHEFLMCYTFRMVRHSTFKSLGNCAAQIIVRRKRWKVLEHLWLSWNGVHDKNTLQSQVAVKIIQKYAHERERYSHKLNQSKKLIIKRIEST